MAVIYLCHIIGQSDKIIKADRTIILRRFYFLNMIYLIKIEIIFFAVKYDLAIFICLKNNLFCMTNRFRFFAKVKICVLTKDPEFDTR